jgi:archaellum biogenesis ATPase FlaH
VIQSVAREFGHDLTRKLRQKGEVIFRVNNQRLASEARKLIEVRHRADGGPQLPQAVNIDVRFQTGADVARRLSMPDNISKLR